MCGKLIDTNLPSQEFINRVTVEKLFDNEYSSITEFEIKEIGPSTVIFILRNIYMSIGYINGKYDFEEVTSFMIPPIRFRKNDVSTLYSSEKFQNKASYEDSIKEALKNITEVLTGERLMKGIVSIICTHRVGVYSWQDIKRITVYDNKFVVIEISQKHFSTHLSSIVNIYAYTTNYGAIKITNLKENDFDKKTADVTKADVEKWMIENHVGLGDVFYDEMLHTNRVEFMGNSIDVIYFNGKNIMNTLSNEDIEKVEKSFNELNSFRKKVGKNITKSMIDKFYKLSDKNVLELTF